MKDVVGANMFPPNLLWFTVDRKYASYITDYDGRRVELPSAARYDILASTSTLAQRWVVEMYPQHKEISCTVNPLTTLPTLTAPMLKAERLAQLQKLVAAEDPSWRVIAPPIETKAVLSPYTVTTSWDRSMYLALADSQAMACEAIKRAYFTPNTVITFTATPWSLERNPPSTPEWAASRDRAALTAKVAVMEATAQNISVTLAELGTRRVTTPQNQLIDFLHVYFEKQHAEQTATLTTLRTALAAM